MATPTTEKLGNRSNPANSAFFPVLYADENKNPFVYLRVAASERIFVVVNSSGRACTAALGEVLEHPLFDPLFAHGTEPQLGDGTYLSASSHLNSDERPLFKNDEFAVRAKVRG
jgi:hypothetical protein